MKKNVLKKLVMFFTLIVFILIVMFICNLNQIKSLNNNIANNNTEILEIAKNIEKDEKISEKGESYEDSVNQEHSKNISEYKDIIKNSDITNINECSKEFMDKYFEDIINLNNEINKESQEDKVQSKNNILIVTSKNKLENTYNAINVIEAPNNQFVLRYNSEEDTKKAYNNFQGDNRIINVDYNKISKVSMENSEEIKNKIKNIKLTDVTNESNEENTYNSWGIEAMGLNKIPKNIEGADEVVVAIMDSGCNTELVNQNYPGKIKETYSVLDTTTDVTDNTGHGTHIAGTISEGTPDNVKILPIKITDSEDIRTIDIITAINYITSNKKANIVNMSFAGTESMSVYTAIEAAKEENIICIAAAGNEASNINLFPAGYDNTISVSSCDDILELSSFSNYYSTVTFCAPGLEIASVNGTMSGTSMATPHIVSAVAVIKSYNKNCTLDEIIDCLSHYCVDLGAVGKDDLYGYGFVNFNNLDICECGCSKCSKIYCNNCECENCVFENPIKKTLTGVKWYIAVETPYNYGTISNLDFSKVKLEYGDKYDIKYALDVDGLDITGYNPNETSYQDIILKYENYEDSLQDVPIEKNTLYAWNYSEITDEEICLDNCEDKIMYLQVKNIYIPKYIEDKKVTKLGDNLFKDKSNITKIVVSETVTTIGQETFCGCTDLSRVYIPNSVTNISNDAFKECPNVTMYIYRNSYAEKYAKENEIKYEYLDGSIVSVDLASDVKTTYNAFETVNTEELAVQVNFEAGTSIEINDKFVIKYDNDNDSFRAGDTKYIIEYDDGSIIFSKEVNVKVMKIKPEYNIPTGLQILENSKIGELKLPLGFKWNNEEELVGEKGEKTFKATYTPEDIKNYEIVSDIDINVLVYEKADYQINDIVQQNNLLSGIMAKVLDEEGNVISKTTVLDLKNQIVLKGGLTCKIYDSSDKEMEDEEEITTACKINILNKDDIVMTYYTVIYGDITCDGMINSRDLLAMKKHLKETKIIENSVIFKSADVNEDNIINSFDLLELKKHLLGKKIIRQNKY